MYFLSISWMSRANGQEDDQRESLSRYIVDKAILKGEKRLVTAIVFVLGLYIYR